MSKSNIYLGFISFCPEVNAWTEGLEGIWDKVTEYRNTEGCGVCHLIIVLEYVVTPLDPK